MMKNEIRVSIGILDFSGAPDQMTEALGIEPSRTWLPGEPVGPGRKPRATNGWELELSASDLEPEELVETLLRRFSEREETVRKLGQDATVVLEVIVYAYEYMPGLCFSPQAIQQLARMNCGIDIDIYDFVEAKAESSAS